MMTACKYSVPMKKVFFIQKYSLLMCKVSELCPHYMVKNENVYIFVRYLYLVCVVFNKAIISRLENIDTHDLARSSRRAHRTALSCSLVTAQWLNAHLNFIY